MLTIPLDKLPLRAGARALDLGCGGGRHCHGLARTPGVTVVGVDLSEAALRDTADGFAWMPGRTGWGVAQAKAERLPFPDDAFDVVICSEVLEHVADMDAVLAEITRITRPGGAFALSVPRGWPEAICWRLAPAYPKEPGGHVRIVKARALRQAVEARGFTFRWRGYAHGLHSPYWWLKCALWSRRDDHPLVRAYQRFLEWDILKRPMLTRLLEACAAPIMGKSVVMHFVKARSASPASAQAPS